MDVDVSTLKRLGYGELDLMVGNWLTCNDVAGHTFLSHPEQDNKRCVRELLAILGKRFPGTLAQLMLDQIEQYRDDIAALYGPGEGAVGRIELEQAVRSWYDLYGSRVEKNWYLQAPLELHFSGNGRERVYRRWLTFLHPDLIYYMQSGFDTGDIFLALRRMRSGGLIEALRVMRKGASREQALFWVELAAWLLGFDLQPDRLEAALAEVTTHAARLSRKQGYPAGPAQAALDYFRRLEKGGLGPEVITGEA
ncbi:MAG TPA: hypothetical protein VH186_38530 [Chloroflexia bacterium]|nr:hypothetical protein [Chloroflexia bacterium]